jgi:hypothetical protein
MTADRRLRVAECEQFFAEHGPRLLAVAEAAISARHAAVETGHECGPVTRLVLPLPTDYPEPMR